MAPPQKRSKRKRTDNRDEPNDAMTVDTVMNSPSPNEMIPTSASKSRHDSIENDREVKDASPPPKRPLVDGAADTEIWDCMMKAMRTALANQTRACGKLLELTDKLYEWTRHLDEEERWIYKSECQNARLDQAVTKAHLDYAAVFLKRLENVPRAHEGQRNSSIVVQVQPSKILVDLLERNMEVLLSELQTQKQAREHAEKKLRGKKQSG